MGIFNTAHKYYREFFNSDGSFKDYEELIKEDNSFYVFSEKQDENDERLFYIEKLYKAILEDIKVNSVALFHLKREFSVRKNIEDFIERYDPELNADTAKTRIIMSAGKINRQFKYVYEYQNNGKSFKYDALETLIKIKCLNKEKYEPVLKECYKEIDSYCRNSSEDTLIKKEIVGIKLNSTAKMINKPSDLDFEEFIETIRPYSKVNVKAVQSMIDNNEDCVAYFNYLVNPTITKEDNEKELSNDLRRMLGLRELYITDIGSIF